jgi:hypothetical protein
VFDAMMGMGLCGILRGWNFGTTADPSQIFALVRYKSTPSPLPSTQINASSTASITNISTPQLFHLAVVPELFNPASERDHNSVGKD